MGEYFQSIVDVEIGVHEAADAKSRLTAWLVDREVIEAGLTDCVLGEPGGGHAPGANYAYALGCQRDYVDPPRLWANGMAISVGRQVYWGGDLEAVICPRCARREQMRPREQGRWDTVFNDAIDDWVRGGAGLVECVGCGAQIGLNDWDWGYPWAFGALGVTVWNWDDLADDFVAEIGQVLGGHRLVYSANKL
ncbi:hypothetical protein AB4Z39_26390 [Mycobacterium adipatum]|uniref:hypothetical protein n=1 Tax=Mycobacterium adipatum TaxID=1682113 RepID=UPI0034E0CB7F